MSHTAPRARDARGRFIARAALTAATTAQQQQAQARPARPIAQARKLTPGPAHLWPAAEGAIYTGTPHGHLTDATLIGYNAPGGVYFAAVYLLGPSAGIHAGRYRVEVCHARAPYDARLCGTFAALDFACLHLGRLEVLAAYRGKRRSLLAYAAGLAGIVRRHRDNGQPMAANAVVFEWLDVQRKLAELRRYYGPALAAIARVSWVPRAPRPVAMVPQVAQLQQAQHISPSTRVVCYEGTDTVAEQTVEITLREFEDEHEASGFSDLDIVIVRRALREGGVAFIGDVGPKHWFAVAGAHLSPSDVLAAYRARTAEVPLMVPMPVQQQQAQHVPAVDCSRGAPMGRPSGDFADFNPADRLSLYRVPINGQGYDAGGAYWGIGKPLYACADQTRGGPVYFRAQTRDAAKAHVAAHVPGARFMR